MKKSELRNLMIVETRDKERYIVVDDRLLSNNGFNWLKDYDDDLLLENRAHKCCDIISVYTTQYWGSGIIEALYNEPLDVVWKREEK